MYSVALLALALLPILVAVMATIGSAVRWLIRWLVPGRPDLLPVTWADAVTRLLEDLALGMAFFPIFYLVVTLVGGAVGAGVIIGVAVAAAAFLAYRLLRRRREFGFPVSVRVSRPDRFLGLFLGVFALIAVVRLASYAPFLVYAGDDIRYFTLITQLVQLHGHYVTSFGPYGDPSWALAVDPHLRFAGSAAIFSALNAWVPWNAPQLVSAAVIDIGILLPCSAFVLYRAIFPGQRDWVPLFGAFALGLFAAYPLFYQDWGGIDEQLNWFLLPIALGLFLRYARGGAWWHVDLLLGGFVFGASLIVNPYPVVYAAIFLLGLIVATAVYRSGAVSVLGRAVLFYAIGLGIAGVVFWESFANIQHTNALIPPGYAGWGAFQTAVLLPAGHWTEWGWNLLEMHTGILATGLVVVVGWVGLAYFSRIDRGALTLLLFALGLLALNSNGPFGLYWVQYPGWNSLYADRPLEWMFLPLAGGVGLVLGVLGRPTLDAPEESSAPPATTRLGHWTMPVAAGTIALAILLAIGGVASAYVAGENAATVGWGSELTPQDVTAFSWMEANLPPGTTTLVNSADSGTWIPSFTELRVFPYLALINSPAVYEETQRLPTQLTEEQFGSVLDLFQQYDIDSAFWGARHGYSEVPQWQPAQFVQPQNLLPFVTHLSTCLAPPGPNESVRLYCNGDSVTFRGPMVLNMTEYEDGLPIGGLQIALANNTSWSFTLNNSAPGYIGSITVTFDMFPLANGPYQNADVFVAVFNPSWIGIEGISDRVQIIPYWGYVPEVPQS
jgi:hypothetical protein